jgi:fatty-acyl-CoA synthase
MTFAEMKREVDRLAAGLLALGLQPGDRIGIWSPNNAAWVLTQYATARAGLILVNINPAYRVAELEYALNKVECRALVTADRFKTSDYLGMLRELAPEVDASTPGQLRAQHPAPARRTTAGWRLVHYECSSNRSCTVVSCPTTGSAIAASSVSAPFHSSGGRTLPSVPT